MLTYERWAVSVLAMGRPCKATKAMTCVPLRDDPLCRACYEDEKAEEGDDKVTA